MTLHASCARLLECALHGDVSVRHLLSVPTGLDQTLTALEAAQALAASPARQAAQLAVTASPFPRSSTLCLHNSRVKRATDVTTRRPGLPYLFEAAEPGTVALLRTAATELQGRVLVVSSANRSRAVGLRGSQLPCVKPANAAPAVAASAEQYGTEALPRLLRSPAAIAEDDMWQIRSLQPGSISSLAAVPFNRCARLHTLAYWLVALWYQAQHIP